MPQSLNMLCYIILVADMNCVYTNDALYCLSHTSKNILECKSQTVPKPVCVRACMYVWVTMS